MRVIPVFGTQRENYTIPRLRVVIKRFKPLQLLFSTDDLKQALTTEILASSFSIGVTAIVFMAQEPRAFLSKTCGVNCKSYQKSHESIANTAYQLLWGGDEVIGVRPNDVVLPFYPTWSEDLKITTQ